MLWKRIVILLAALPALWGAAFGVAWLRVAVAGTEPSRSSGAVASGALENGRPIRPWSAGCVTYSYVGAALGRQYVHAAVRDVLAAACGAMAAREPGLRFVVGETGWPSGGRFRPHRTHQNGLSVDVFVPVIDEAGMPATLDTWPWNEFGYGWEFDGVGRSRGLRVDFEALSTFLLALHEQASARGLTIRKIIIAPEYVPHLLATRSGNRFGSVADVLSRGPAWVRHDEHVHVDFALPQVSGARRSDLCPIKNGRPGSRQAPRDPAGAILS